MMTPPPLRPGMLPPSPDPLPMPDLKDGEWVWYQPPVRPEMGESGYWAFKDPHTSSSADTLWVNRSDFPGVGPSREEFYDNRVLPHFLSTRPAPKRMGEYYRGLSHMVSERVVNIFRDFDPDGFKSIEINMEFKDGLRPEQRYYWIYVTRQVSAIDYPNSRIYYKKTEGYPSRPAGCSFTRLLPEAYQFPYFCNFPRPGGRLIFVCDEMKKRFIKDKIRYVKLVDISNPITSL